MPQVFVFVERNAKGGTFDLKNGATVGDLKRAVNDRQEQLKTEFKSTSLLLGGISKVLDHRMTFTGPEMTLTGPLDGGHALGFQGCPIMASQLLPGPLNPGS